MFLIPSVRQPDDLKFALGYADAMGMTATNRTIMVAVTLLLLLYDVMAGKMTIG